MKKLSYSVAVALAAFSAAALTADLVIIQPSQEDLVVKLKDVENAIQFSADGTVYIRVDEDIKVTDPEPVDLPVCNVPTRRVDAGSSTSYNVANFCQAGSGQTLNTNSVAFTRMPTKGSVSAASGTISYTANSAASGTDSFRFTVADNNGNVSLPVTASINIDEGGGGNEGCDPLNHNLTRDTRVGYRLGGGNGPNASSTKTTWRTQAGGANPQYVGIPNGRYAALEFTTDGPYAGSTTFEQTTYAPPASNVIVTISECPGQFTNVEPGCSADRRLPGLLWAVESNDSNSNWTCSLRPNKRYYMNIATAESLMNINTNSCSSGECGLVYTH